MVPARPFFMGSDGWVRSNACTWLFSSRHSTTAFSGGFRYSPTTSTSFSSNRGSFDSLNVSTRCGCSPRARQTRCTVSRLTPTRAAIVRVDQCVAPGGASCNVTRTISFTVSAGIEGLRPRASPSSANRAPPPAHRHRRHRHRRSDRHIRQPVRRHQQRLRPPHLAIRRRRRPRQHLQRLPLTRRDRQSIGSSTRPTSLPQIPLFIWLTHHEQREGRVDRFGQRRDTVRAVTLYGRDNSIDGIVL